MTNKPNLLFVFADQMRGMDIACAGNPDIATPAMDRLAAEGIRLTNCIATLPVCGPNRATLLTGRYPRAHRVAFNELPVRTGLPTLGTVARDHGYATAYIGKWHLDGPPRSKFTPPGPRRLGFDYWAVYNCAHEYFRPRYYRDTDELIETEGYEPEVQTGLALDFLDNHARHGDRPFCMVLSWGPPHNPYDQVPPQYRCRYDPEKLQLRPNAQPDADNPIARKLDCRRTTADYYAAITALDDQLDRLLRKLHDLGLSEDTIVVFTSDHGDMLWSHGLMRKQLPYEESVNVPFILRWPGKVPAASRSDLLLGWIDILPTLCGLMGCMQPDNLEGLDLSAFLTGGPAAQTAAEPVSAYIAGHVNYSEAERQGMPPWRGVRTKRHTYVEKPHRVPWLLFDNRQDPYQMRNLIDDPAAADIRAALRDQLAAWMDRLDDPPLSSDDTLRRLGLYEDMQECRRLYHAELAKRKKARPAQNI